MNTPQSDFAGLVDRFHELMTRDANACIHLGVDRNRDRLPEPSLESAMVDVADARRLLEASAALDVAQLDPDQQLDRELMELQLRRLIHQESLRFNGRTTREQLPNAADGISDGIFMLFIADPRPAAERIADITARIERIPGYLDAMAGRLDRPVARWLTMELDKLAGLPELMSNIADWAGQQAEVDQPRLSKAILQANAALQGYAGELRGMPAVDEFHLDHADAQELVRLAGIELDFDELHTIARRFLATNREQVEELRARLCARYGLAADVTAAELQIYLARRYATAPDQPLDAILERYREEVRRIEAFLASHDLFPVPDNQAIKILRTPSFLEPSIPAGAMNPPAPFAQGVRTSLVFLTLSESLRAEHTELGIPAMMIHEGIPGHHLQLATASMHPSIVRRHVSANDHAEGWTTMLEDYMLDQGYMGELTDEARFITKRDLSRIGARVAIDLFFMTGERDYLDVGIDCDISPANPFEAAGNLLAEVTGFVPGRVQAELNWYSQERGYPLSYLAGNALVWQLKADMATHRSDLAEQDRDRLFHQTYLQSGNMPVSFLRRVFARQGLIAA